MTFHRFLQRYGAYLVAALLFVGASVILCFPALQGKVLYASDNVNARCAASEAYNYHQETGKVTWWTDSMFSGMPVYQVKSGQYKADRWLAPVKALEHAGRRHVAGFFILYFFCFFVLVRSFGTDKWLSIVGAFALTLSSYFVIIVGAGHNTKATTIALMSVVLAGFWLIFRKKYGLGAVACLVCAAAGITTHPQMSYYILLLIGVLWIGELVAHVRQKKMKDFLVATAIFAGCVGVGTLANASSVFANMEFVEETNRGSRNDVETTTFLTHFNYSPLESFSLLVPGVVGGQSHAVVDRHSRFYKKVVASGVSEKDARQLSQDVPLYWGSQTFTEGNVYVGALVCFLFLLGLLLVRGPAKWCLLAATVFSLLLALGDHLMPLSRFFFTYFPFYSKFRAVASILVVAEITMPLLGFMGVQRLLDGSVDRQKALRSIWTAAGVTAGICLFFALLGPSLLSFMSEGDAGWDADKYDWMYRAVIAQRKWLLVHDSLRSALFILAGAALIFLFGKGKLKRGVVIAGLGLLVVLDMWPVDRRFFSERLFRTSQNNDEAYEEQPWETEILQAPGFFRVLNLSTGQAYTEARTSLRLHSVGGYSAAKLRRYQDLIDEHLLQGHLSVVNMLNAQYLVMNDEKGVPQASLNPDAMGNAWFVDEISAMPDEEMELFALDAIDLKTKAVVSGEAARYATSSATTALRTPDPERYVRLTGHTPDSREYSFCSHNPEYVVFSEIYYPYGWKVTVDGKKAEYFRANYALRAMFVPAGRHDIRFVFDPDSVKKGDRLALCFILLLYLAVAGIAGTAVVRQLRSRRPRP